MPAFAAGDIENEKQDTAPGNVTEKIVAQPDVAMRAFDQTRNIRDRRAAIADERRVRHRAELEKKMSLLALLAFAVLNWRAVFRAFEMHVPLPATTALA